MPLYFHSSIGNLRVRIPENPRWTVPHFPSLGTHPRFLPCTQRRSVSKPTTSLGYRLKCRLANDTCTYSTSEVTRHFLVLCHDTSELTARGQFDANNLLDGRVDVWCRIISNALYYSDGIRKNTKVWLFLQPTGECEGLCRSSSTLGCSPHSLSQYMG